MGSARKRTIHEVDGDAASAPKQPSMLQRIRNMWQFANICQFLAIFGPALKIDAVDVDSLETECLKPQSRALQEIGLGFLKFLSSHRGLSHDLFDEYTRRQFASKAPNMDNPFGDEAVALKFTDFDVFKQLQVLHQMMLLIWHQPEKIRERMAEMKDADHDHTSWRIEPLGWDEDDRSYFLLDDNRLYRLTEAPVPEPPAPKPKKNSKKAKALARAEKRRRISEAQESAAEPADDTLVENEEATAEAQVAADDGLGGAKWECIAVGLSEVHQFLAPLKRTKDPNEKILRDRIQEHLVPILEREEDRRLKKEKERQKELLNIERMAHAKRSSRIAHKAEKVRQDEQAHLDEQKRLAEQAAARKEQELQRKLEKERNRRLMSREKRVQEREARRLRHEEELAQLSEDSRGLESGGSAAAGRLSSRSLQLKMERSKQALQELEDEEEEWVFDCVCGLYGQVDDGEHSVACERCNVWQHSKCIGVDKEKAERDDFHFVCETCRKCLESKQRMRSGAATIIKLRVGSAVSTKAVAVRAASESDGGSRSRGGSRLVIELPAHSPASSAATIDDNPQAPKAKPSSPVLPPPSEQPRSSIPIKASVLVPADGQSKAVVLSPAASNGVHNPFSSPHPDLSPPQQSPNKSRAYSTMYDQSSPPAVRGENGHANGTASKPNGRVTISTTPILPPVPPNRASYSQGKPAPSPLKPAVLQSSKADTRSTVAGNDATPPPASLQATPQIKPMQSDASYQKSSPLPPASGGVSPTKHSPSFPPASSNGFLPSSSPAPPVLPPVAALSPSPRPQDPTPPVKSTVAGQAPASSFGSDIS